MYHFNSKKMASDQHNLNDIWTPNDNNTITIKSAFNENAKLVDLLTKLASEGATTYHTYLTTLPNIKTWNIPYINIAELLIGYCDIISDTGNILRSYENYGMCLAEKQSNIRKLSATLNFTFDISNKCNSEEYSFQNKLLLLIVYAYQTAIMEVLNVDGVADNKYATLAVVLATQVPWYYNNSNITSTSSNTNAFSRINPKQNVSNISNNNTYMCMAIKIYFPYTNVDISIQNRHIREKVIHILNNTNTIKYVDLSSNLLFDDWEHIVAVENTISSSMYKSTDVHKKSIFEYIGAYDMISKDFISKIDSAADNIVPLQKDQYFSIEYHDIYKNPDIYGFQNTTITRSLDYFFPLLFTNGYYSEGKFELKQRKSIQIQAPIVKRYSVNGPSDAVYKKINPTPKEISTIMLEWINPMRYTKYCEWINIGKALYNTYIDDSDGLDLWIAYTINNYNATCNHLQTGESIEHICKKLFKSKIFTKNNSMTIKTLAWYAKIDSPDNYKKWHLMWCDVSKNLDMLWTHRDISKVIYRIYWLDFIYASHSKLKTKGQWYIYKNGKWENNNTIDLDNLIEEKCSQFFGKLKRKIAFENAKEEFNNDSNADHSKNNKNITMIEKIITNCGNFCFRQKIIKNLIGLCNVNNCDLIFNKSQLLTGVKNGVLQVDNHNNNLIFKKHQPEDYITNFMEINYKEYKWDHPKVQKVMSYLSLVFPNKKLLNWELRRASSLFGCSSDDPLLTIFVTNEQHTSYIKLYRKIFGDYAVSVDTKFFFNKKATNIQKMAHIYDKKIIFLYGDHLQYEKKNLGLDNIYNLSIDQPRYKLIYQIDDVSDIISTNIVNGKYISIVPLNSTADRSSEIASYDVSTMKKAYLWVLKQYYIKYLMKGINNIPDAVNEYVNSFLNKNNIISSFCDNRIEYDMYSSVLIDMLYTNFRDFMIEKNVKTTISYQKFKREITKIYKDLRPSGSRISGIRLILHPLRSTGEAINNSQSIDNHEPTTQKTQTDIVSIVVDETIIHDNTNNIFKLRPSSTTSINNKIIEDEKYKDTLELLREYAPNSWLCCPKML